MLRPEDCIGTFWWLDTLVLVSGLAKYPRNHRLLRRHRPGGRVEGSDKRPFTGVQNLYRQFWMNLPATLFIPWFRLVPFTRAYFLGTSIARPLIAKRMVEIARKEKAQAIAHGATGKGNDQIRFELTVAALAPELEVIAPWRDAEFRETFPGRKEMIAYCAKKKIPVEAGARKPYSMDRNLLHISYEAGILEDPWLDASAPKFKDIKLSVSPEDAPDKPEYVNLDFEQGRCVALNGKKMSPLEVMRKLNRLGGKHGVGRVDLVENRFVGMKSRGVYETPGGSILLFAHRQIESLTMDREVMHLRDSLIPKYAELVYYGFWFAPEREALQALVSDSQKHVTGRVRIKLYKGNIITAGRQSPLSL